MEIWAELLQRELQRVYDLTTPVNVSGSSSISPVFIVGPGADPAFTAVSRFAGSYPITAVAGQTGNVAVTLPQGDPRVIVLRTGNLWVTAATAWQFLLNSQIGAFAPNALPPVPINKRNNPSNQGPNCVFTSTNSNAIGGDLVGNPVGSQNVDLSKYFPVVITAGSAFIVAPVGLALTWTFDFIIDVYQPQSK